MSRSTGNGWRNRANVALGVFLAIGGYLVWAEHRVHLAEYLPWILVLACVGMHLFMHGGQGHGGHAGHGEDAGGDGRRRGRDDDAGRGT